MYLGLIKAIAEDPVFYGIKTLGSIFYRNKSDIKHRIEKWYTPLDLPNAFYRIIIDDGLYRECIVCIDPICQCLILRPVLSISRLWHADFLPGRF